MISEHALDLAPVAVPKLARTPVGRPVEFAALVRAAGMREVTSGAHPMVTVHAGPSDLRVPSPGCPVYCIGGATLPAADPARAKEIIRRLAYGFLDWAAREVVGRYHRDLKRGPQVKLRRRPGLPPAVLVRRALRRYGTATVGELAALTGIAQPNVSRTVAELVASGEVWSERSGRSVLCRLAAQPAGPTDRVDHTGRPFPRTAA